MKFVSIILLSAVLYADCYRKATHDDQSHQLIKRADPPDNDTAKDVGGGTVDESVPGVPDTENRDDNSEHRDDNTGDGKLDESVHREEHGENPTSMPKFVSKIVFHTPTSFTIELQPSGSFGSAIQACEIVVVKLDKDANGLPRLTKPNTDLFLSFSPYHGLTTPQDPYIAARYGTAIFPRRITIGDNNHYGGLMNGELEPSSYYAIFLRGVAKRGTETRHIVSDYISDYENPSIPAYFPTDEPNNNSLFIPVMISLGGLMMMAILISAFFFLRKGSGPDYTQLFDISDTADTEADQERQSKRKRKSRSKSLEKGKLKTLKNAKNSKKDTEKAADQKRIEEIALKTAKQIKRLGDQKAQKDGRVTEGMEVNGNGELERLRSRMEAYRKGVGQKLRGEQDGTSTFKFILEGQHGVCEVPKKKKEEKKKEKKEEKKEEKKGEKKEEKKDEKKGEKKEEKKAEKKEEKKAEKKTW